MTRRLVYIAHVVSIHAPREGRDEELGNMPVATLFQSTRPARGATSIVATEVKGLKGFNPRAPRGARHAIAARRTEPTRSFNPRAPRGARQPQPRRINGPPPFQSTRPARGATFHQIGVAHYH